MLDAGYDLPFTLGHELAGVTPNGTPVAIEPLAYCGHCQCCIEGRYNLCLRSPGHIMGVGRDGGMAEELLVPPHALVPLASSVRVEDACLVEPLSVAVRGLGLARLNPSHTVAVIGGGSIGLCAVAAAREITPRVHLYARHDPQRQAGEQLGAVLEGGDEAHLVIDCAGTGESIAQAVNLARPGGTILLLATYWQGLELPAVEMSLKELQLVTSMAQARQGLARDVDLAATLLARQPRLASALITHRLPLEAAEEAFAVARNRQAGAIKVVLQP